MGSEIKIPVKCTVFELLSFLKAVEQIFNWKNKKNS